MIIIRDHTINDIGDDHSPWGIPFEKANSIGLPDLDIGSWIRKILYGQDGFVHAPKSVIIHFQIRKVIMMFLSAGQIGQGTWLVLLHP